MKKLLPLNNGDLMEVKSGFTQGKRGTITSDDALVADTYKLDFHDGWVGWQHRSNLRIIKRSKKS